jgi:hypothetical protein
MNLVRGRNAPFRWALVCLVGCSGSEASPFDAGQQANGVKFGHDVAPIFSQSCTFCHHPGSATAVDFTHPFDPDMGIIRRPNSWTKAAATLLVDPGNVANSFLIDKVARADLDPHVEGNRMPWGPPKVTPDEVAAIRKWITDGANDDDFYQANVATVFGDGMSLGSKGGKCSYCHYANTYQLPDLTHPFDKNVGVVNVPSSHGAKLVMPGDPDSSFLVQKIEAQDADAGVGNPMPMQFPLLQPAQIEILKTWVAQGAQNN